MAQQHRTARDDPVRPRLASRRQELRVIRRAVEAVAERGELAEHWIVVKIDITGRAQRQDTGLALRPETERGQIPRCVERQVATRVDNLRARPNPDHRREPRVVCEQPTRNRVAVAGKGRAVREHVRLHRVVDDGRVEKLVAFDNDLRSVENRPVDRIDLHVEIVRGLRRAQMQRAAGTVGDG